MKKLIIPILLFCLSLLCSTSWAQSTQVYEVKFTRTTAEKSFQSQSLLRKTTSDTWKSGDPSLDRIFTQKNVVRLQRMIPENPSRIEEHKAFDLDLHYYLYIDSDENSDEILAAFRKLGQVLHIQTYVPHKLNDQSFGLGDPTNDEHFGSQWGFNNTQKRGQDINVVKAWERSTGDPRVVVAIIDNCVDPYHEDFIDNVWKNPREIRNNGVDDDENGYIDDLFGWNFVDQNSDVSPKISTENHGTHVTGMVGARANNNKGVAGVAGGWGNQAGVQLMLFRAGKRVGADDMITDGYAAMTYAADNGANIAQCSWGGKGSSMAAQEVCNYFMRMANGGAMKGGLVIAAAGNDDMSSLHYPSGYEGVLAVSAIQSNGNKSSFSNYGVWVDIAAPGTQIYSTLPYNSYGNMNGTSMACPIVSGVAALVLSAAYDAIPQDMKTSEWLSNILKKSATPFIPNIGYDMGSGLVNADSAIQMALQSATSLRPHLATEKTTIKVFPNPSSDYVFIIDEQNAFDKIEIVNMQGAVMYSSSQKKNSLCVNVQNFPSSLYVIHVYHQQKVSSHKLLKQ